VTDLAPCGPKTARRMRDEFEDGIGDAVDAALEQHLEEA